MTWNHLGDGARELARTVHDDGYRSDIVLAIARGELLVGRAVAYWSVLPPVGASV